MLFMEMMDPLTMSASYNSIHFPRLADGFGAYMLVSVCLLYLPKYVRTSNVRHIRAEYKIVLTYDLEPSVPILQRWPVFTLQILLWNQTLRCPHFIT